MMWIKKILNDLLGLFFPNLCVICEAKLHDNEKHICNKCLIDLPLTHCINESNPYMVNLFGGRFPFNQILAYAYFTKGGKLQRIIHEIKYADNPELALFMGRLCGISLQRNEFIKSIDYLIPVPLHPKREKKRGYNQSLELCKGISEVIGIPINTTLVRRTVNNQSQVSTESREKRWTNVKDIFDVTNSENLNIKNILIVDDVITTGSTLESLVKAILKEIPCSINIYALGCAINI